MKIHISKTIKPATPWNVSIARLTNLENNITTSEGDALKARWQFGCELVSRRIEYKGQRIIPHDLMALTLEKCHVSRREVQLRVRFALRYPTKDLCRDAITTYQSWYRITHEALVEKRRSPTAKKRPPAVAREFVLRRLVKAVDQAFVHHATLTQAQVKDLEHLFKTIQKILDQVDRNDLEKAEKKAS